MAKRLIKIAKELNVGTTLIVEHLTNSGFEIENKPTANVTDEMYEELLKEFQKSIAIKEKADQLVIGNRPTSAPLKEKRKDILPPPPPPEEEPARLQAGLKVLGKIDLDGRLASASARPIINEELEKQTGSIDLKGLNLSIIPEELFKLTHLTRINLSNNRIKKIPDKIKKLRKLRFLNLSNNQFIEFPNSLTDVNSLYSLNISNNSIEYLTNDIGYLNRLRILDLSDNQISELTPKIWRCSNLSTLSLHGNQLTFLPEELKDLKRLENLNITNNLIEKLPDWLINIPSLEELRVKNNPISNVPEARFNKDGNRLNAIRDHFESIRGQNAVNLYEVKLMLVGEPESGKTSIAKKLKDPDANIEDEKSTEGIDIKKWSLDVSDMPSLRGLTNNSVRVNIWDFGGQEIYRSTHRFFLTHKSIYILVWNARVGNLYDHLGYWLNTVKTWGGDSKLILVKNKIEQRKDEINLELLQKRFPIICDFVRVSCTENIGINSLIAAIKNQIAGLSHLGETWQIERVKIREQLESKIDQPWIRYEEYEKICKDNKLNNQQAKEFSEYLHDLGVIMYYPDNPLLKNTVFLKPEWVTSCVYDILDNEELKEESRKGEFTKNDLEFFWKDKSGFIDRIDDVIELMKEFQICFELPKKNTLRRRKHIFIAPELLPDTPKSYVKLKDEFTLSFEYAYDFLPSGILNSFICQNYSLIEGENVWKNGVVLNSNSRHSSHASRAEITIDPLKRDKIRIRVFAKKKEDRIKFLEYIRLSFNSIHEMYGKNLKVQELVPCNCYTCSSILKTTDGSDFSSGIMPTFYKYVLLKKCEEIGRKFLFCEAGLVDVNINNLIRGIDRLNLKVFISYSKENEKQKREFIKHLKVIERSGKITVWDDSHLEGGDKWEKMIMAQLESSNIIVIILSPDYINTDFCWKELEKAVSLSEQKGTLVIPIILQKCNWEKTPISEFQVFPEKGGKPIDDYKNKDKVWTEMVEEIDEIVDREMKNKFS